MSLYNFISIDLGAVRVPLSDPDTVVQLCSSYITCSPNPNVKWEIISGQSPPHTITTVALQRSAYFCLHSVLCFSASDYVVFQKLWSLSIMQRTLTVGQRGGQASVSAYLRSDINCFSDYGWRWYHLTERFQGECERLLIPPCCCAYSRSCHHWLCVSSSKWLVKSVSTCPLTGSNVSKQGKIRETQIATGRVKLECVYDFI